MVYKINGSGYVELDYDVERCRSRGTLLELWLGKRPTSRDKGREKWLHRGCYPSVRGNVAKAKCLAYLIS